MARKLKFFLKDHYAESLPFGRALILSGHELVNEPGDVLLIDLDPPLAGYRNLIDTHSNAGAKVILYPHGGGGPVLSYDGLWEPYHGIDGNLVAGVGQAEFLRRIGYPSPVHVVGWSLCDMRPFTPRAEVNHVVFAPTHPNADGSMMSARRDLNAEVFAKLLEGPWRLTVRYIGTLEQNGLWEVDDVEFVDGRLRAQTAEIDVCDAVVAGDGTFPTLAIARGVPTVMYGQATLALGLPDEQPSKLRRSDLYLDYIRYPLDVADGPLDELIHAAAADDASIAEWRRRFIGRPFDPKAVVAAIEGIAYGTGSPILDATRQRTTLAFADELAEHPDLLRTYVDAVSPEDDATLVIWAPGLDDKSLLAVVELALERAGIDADRLPDALLAPLPGSPATDALLAERADAVLSRWPKVGRIGRLPAFSPATSGA
jgi:hypothetical protein